jgi:putative redox protein
MDATAVWNKGLSFTATGHKSGFSLPLGGEPKVEGEQSGFRPTELLLVGLAGCTGMDVISILEKKRLNVIGFEVKVHGDRAETDPKLFTRFAVEYIVKGRGIDPAAVQRAVALSETKYCGVMATLRAAGPVELKVTVLEA